MIKIINIKGTSDYSPDGFKSWISYWEHITGLTADTCMNVDCNNKTDLVGAHVQKYNSSDKFWRIVPLCKECNKKTEPFWVKQPLALIGI